MLHSQFTYELQRREMQRKRNTKQLSKTNDLFISLVFLSYVLFLWKYWRQSGGKYASFFNIFSV